MEDEERYETDVPEEADWRTRAQQWGAPVSLNKSHLKTWAKICDSMRYEISYYLHWHPLEGSTAMRFSHGRKSPELGLVQLAVYIILQLQYFKCRLCNVQGWIYWTRRLPSWKHSKLGLFSKLCSIGFLATQRPARQKEEEEKGVSGEVVTITTKLPDVHCNETGQSKWVKWQRPTLGNDGNDWRPA